MLGPIVWLVIGAGTICLGIAAVFWIAILRRGRRVGTRGYAQRSHLTCPKCHREFDYDWIPGTSLSAVRLGWWRYMACPLCHKWSVFNVYEALVERAPTSTADSGTH